MLESSADLDKGFNINELLRGCPNLQLITADLNDEDLRSE